MKFRDIFNRAIRTTQANQQYEGELGKPLGNDEFEAGPDDQNPYINYVVLTQGEGQTIIEAYNTRVPYQPGLTVLVEKDKDDAWVIVGVDTSRAITQMGSLGQTVAVAPHSHQIGSGMDDTVEGMRMLPGGAFWQTSFTFYVEPLWYWHDRARHYFGGGTIDISSAVPFYKRQRWVKIGINPVTKVLEFEKGQTYSEGYLLDESHLELIKTDLIEVLGVQLYASDADVEEYTRFVDLRLHIHNPDQIGFLDTYYEPMNQRSGQISVLDGTRHIALTDQDTWYKIVSFKDIDIQRGTTPVIGNDYHIEIDQNGYYIVLYTCSAHLHTASRTVQIKAMLNNGTKEVPGSLAEVDMTGSQQTHHFSGTAIMRLNDGDTVELWARRTNGGAVSVNFHADHATLIVTGAN